MSDYLIGYNIDQEEKERILFLVLKRIRAVGREPRFLQKRRNFKVYGEIRTLYGEKCIGDVLYILKGLGLIKATEPGKPYVITKKGNEFYKRGYISMKINRYSDPKYAIYISAAALAVSILGNDYFWKAIGWIAQKLSALTRWLQDLISRQPM